MTEAARAASLANGHEPRHSSKRMIDVWLLRPDTVPDSELGAAESILSDQERARHQRYLFAPDRRLFLVSHAFLRHTLSRYAAVAPQDWRFAENAHGRPEVADPVGMSSLRFSLSHVGGLVACLVTSELDAGVDLEAIRPSDGLEPVARSSFSPEERRDLQRLSGPERDERFFACWTLKEAYAKARGRGLSLPFEKISFVPDAEGGATMTLAPDLAGRAEGWRFQLCHPTAEHLMAVAWRAEAGEERTVSIFRANGLRSPAGAEAQ